MKIFTHHIVHLVSDILEPGLGSFNLSEHACKLLPNDCLCQERLAEDISLVSPPKVSAMASLPLTHFKHSSTAILELLAEAQHMTQRSCYPIS